MERGGRGGGVATLLRSVQRPRPSARKRVTRERLFADLDAAHSVDPTPCKLLMVE